MKKKNLPWLFLFIPLFILGTVLFRSPTPAQSATAGHIVISEVQIAGATAGDEFVELYNPTSSVVDLSGWRLRRETSTGGDGGNLVASLSGNIPAHGFFLVTPQSGYTGSASADQMYSVAGNPVAANNTVLLFSDAAITLVEKVGVGSGASTAEGTGTATPAAGQSVERKANPSSTDISMGSGGVDEFGGNGEDTNDNSADLVLRNVSQPQNSSSAVEPVSGTPTEIPTPTTEPSITPSETPTPTLEPSITPTEVPIPTLSPTPTATPTVSPSPTRKPPFFFPRFQLTCSVTYKTFNFGFFRIQIPLISCQLKKVI